MKDFYTLNIPTFLAQALEKMQITVPTAVQAEAIPVALEGRDILASAQTGTGKTIAFLIPLIVHLISKPESLALVLTPTRELAVQVKTALQKILGENNAFSTALLIGGEPMSKQYMQLRRRPRCIIGTPGRIYDHLQRKSLQLKNASFLVLDETDRMLDMGFNEQLKSIMPYLAEQRQTLMFSATLPENIVSMTKKYLKNYHHISIGLTNKPSQDITQDILHTSIAEKFTHLLNELEKREGSVIVFVRTRRDARELAFKLQNENHSADAIHGDLEQRKRERLIRAFRSAKSRILVATDIAARGLDIPHVQHVINYDLPECPEDYIHRIGRTGRAGAKGYALSFIAQGDKNKWRSIYKLMNPEAKTLPAGEPSEKMRSRQNRRPSFGGKSNSRKSFFGARTYGSRKPQARNPR